MARIRSKRHRKNRRNKIANKWVFWGVLVLAIFLAVVWISRTSFVEITTLSFPADSPLSKQALTSAAERGVDTQSFLIDRDNVLLYNDDKVAEHVSNISGQVSSVDVQASGLRTLEVVPELYTPQAKVCTQTTSTSTSFSGEDCKYIAESGYIFSVDGRDLTTPLAPFYTPDEKLVGTYLLPTAQFESLTTFIENLESINLTPERIVTKPANDVYIETGNNATSSTEVRINTSDDLVQAFSDLLMLVENNSFEDEESGDPVSPQSLEYIDLRFENKVFYR